MFCDGTDTRHRQTHWVSDVANDGAKAIQKLGEITRNSGKMGGMPIYLLVLCREWGNDP